MSSNLYKKHWYDTEEGGVTYLEIEEDLVCLRIRSKRVILDIGSQIIHYLRSSSLYIPGFFYPGLIFLRVNIPDKFHVITQCFMIY